jgi:hypothetical protein
MTFFNIIFTPFCLLWMVLPLRSSAQGSVNYVKGTVIELNDNGAWSWFMDERAIIHRDQLIVGSVRAVGKEEDNQSDPNWGNIEISVYDIQTGKTGRTVLHHRLEQDDHNCPALMVLPDGRYLAVYSKHAVERKVYYRFSEPGDPLKWGPATVFITPGEDQQYGGNNVTYSNLFQISSGRIYNFYRGFSHDPNYMYSDDEGTSWNYGGRYLKGRDGYSPYVKYAFCKKHDVVHLVATEDHPRNFDNCLYHGFIRDEKIFQTDGRLLADMSKSTEVGVATWDMTRVYQGDPDHVAWMVDMELDDKCSPYILFSVQRDGRDLPPRQGGMDLRYYYANWDGNQWHVNEIAYAGTRLYPFEDDYSGLGAIDPSDPDIVYISTDADPVNGRPLISKADGARHHEIYRGETNDHGKSWEWIPITSNSSFDNLRPLVPKWDDERTALVWMRGGYFHNHGEWYTSVVAVIIP